MAEEESLVRRIIAFPLVLLLIGGALVVLAAVLGSSSIGLFGLSPDSPLYTLGALFTAVLVALTYAGFRRWIERGANRELAIAGAGRELLAGLLGGFALFALVALAIMALGGMRVLGINGMGKLWALLAMAIVSGVFEEVLFRGLIQRQLEALVGTWAALGLTSAFFGVAHIFNPGATWWSSLAVALEAGILLGAAYLCTRRLWLPIGLHAGWNFTQGWVFGGLVSGGEAQAGLLVTRWSGPEWLTGGAFGPEASVVALVAALSAGLALLWLAHRREGFVRPAWRRDQTKL